MADRDKILPPIRHFIEVSPKSYERLLIIACIHSLKFYRTHRDFICPTVDQRARKDFATHKYNIIFDKIREYWAPFDNVAIEHDLGIPRVHLAAFLTDLGNTAQVGTQPFATVKELIDEDLPDVYNLDKPLDAPYFEAISGNAFQYWLESRLVKSLCKDFSNLASSNATQLDQAEALVQKAKRSLSGTRNNVVLPHSRLRGNRVWSPKIKCRLKELNKAMGGGFDRDGVAMVAGANGAGKTVFACQLAVDFASSGYPTVIVGTEQGPDDMLERMVANVTTTSMDEFQQRRDFTLENQTDTDYSMPVIPDWMFNDPRTAEPLREFEEKVCPNLRFVDWSKDNYSIASHFDNEMDKLKDEGFDPAVVIFDYIGKGLDTSTKFDFDKLRHLYEGGVNHLALFARKYRKAVVLLAQFNKTMVENKQTTTMSMLSESKTMTNGITSFIGMSCLREKGDTVGKRIATRQYFNVDKCRNGEGGRVDVETHFKFQRFSEVRQLNKSSQ